MPLKEVRHLGYAVKVKLYAEGKFVGLIMKARTHFEVASTGSEAMDEFLKTQKNLRALSTTDEGPRWV